MKKCLILALSALVAGCDQKGDSSGGNISPTDINAEATRPLLSTSVIVTDQTKGNFVVDARTSGATFENRSDNAATFVFRAQGEWSFAPGGTLLGPSGTTSPAPANFLLPGANSFELVMKRGDGKYAHIGDGGEVTLAPREVISFAMNDVAGAFSDNRGWLTVDWSKMR